MDFEYILELFFGGLTRGSIYALIALGYTMVYGVIGLINFAHGEIYMIGAFMGLIISGVLTMLTGLSEVAILFCTLAGAVVYASAYGFTLEKIAYTPLRGSPRLSVLISAIGMSIFLQNFVLLSQGSEFVAYPQLVRDLEFLDPYYYILRTSEFVILIAAVLSMLILFGVIQFTKVGKAMRAIAQDQKMALLLGVNVNRTISATFVIGSAFAAVGGVLIASHMGQINFYIGFVAGIKAFTAAVLGGIGSVPGAALGGFILGCTESFAAGYLSSDYEDVCAFALLVLILIFKPEGILGKSVAEKV
jgi:branched-chain amino acid transport system permease protein